MSEPAGKPTNPTPTRGPLIWAGVAALIAHTALAQADQLELNALVQEGDLILEEAAALAPATKLLAQEGLEIATSDKALREEVQALNRDISQFNAAMAEHNEGAQALQAQCAGQTGDKALVEACNTRLTQLRDQANMLEEERSEVRARQEEINTRVEKHNASARDYAKRKQEQDSRDRLNQRDAEDWLGRARQFLASKDFAAWLAQAGSPASCGAEQMTEIVTLPLHPALERAQACLKAVKAGSR
jgi:hypothetical protein